MGFPGGTVVKNPPVNAGDKRDEEMPIRPLGWEDPLEKGIATHCSTLCPENPMDRGAWQATIHGVTKGQSDTIEAT